MQGVFWGNAERDMAELGLYYSLPAVSVKVGPMETCAHTLIHKKRDRGICAMNANFDTVLPPPHMIYNQCIL